MHFQSDNADSTAAEGSPPGESSDTRIALRNAFKIGGSLIATWSIALIVRFVLPRTLGPEQFGTYVFADAFTATFFMLSTLGLETYIQKEISVRREHANDFFGGTLALRLVVSALLIVLIERVMAGTGRPAEVRVLACILALGQILATTNASLAALLQAISTVGGLSLTNVASKLLWGFWILLALHLRAGLPWLGAAFLLSEAVKAATLFRLARRHLGLRLAVDLRATRAVLVASLPFFLATLSLMLHSRLDATFLAFLTNDAEVGWYGAASNLAGLTLLLAPLVSSILQPLFARAAARSEAELLRVMRRALELVLTLAIPISLALAVGADVWLAFVSGEEFLPAVPCLRVLASLFVVTYVAIFCSTCLTQLGKGWTVTLLSVVGLVASPLLNLALIPPMHRLLGAGGGSAGAALASTGTEVLMTLLLLNKVGWRVLDRRTVTRAAKMLGAGIAVVVLDRALLGLGAWRLLFDAGAYIALVLASGAVQFDEATEFARFALRQRREAKPGAIGA